MDLTDPDSIEWKKRPSGFATSIQFWDYIAKWCEKFPPTQIYITTYSFDSYLYWYCNKITGEPYKNMPGPKRIKPVQKVLEHVNRAAKNDIHNSFIVVGNLDTDLTTNYEAIELRIPHTRILCGNVHSKIVILRYDNDVVIWHGSANMTANSQLNGDNHFEDSDKQIDTMLEVRDKDQQDFLFDVLKECSEFVDFRDFDKSKLKKSKNDRKKDVHKKKMDKLKKKDKLKNKMLEKYDSD